MRSLLKHLFICGTILSVVGFNCSRSAAQTEQSNYSITDLGTLEPDPTTSYTPHGTNKDRVIVGEAFSYSPVGFWRAFCWKNGTMRRLSPLSGGSGNVAHGVNDLGIIVGESQYQSGRSDAQRAVIWNSDSSSSPQDIGTLPGFENSIGNAINNHNQVVGYAYTPTDPARRHAFIWDAASGMRDLGALGDDYSTATSINDRGEVVGWSAFAAKAFIWSEADGMQSLGLSEESRAEDINNSGYVVGNYGSSLDHAFLWHKTSGVRELSTPGAIGARAYAINENNQVVGSYDTGAGSHAFIWDNVNGVRDLNDLIPPNSGWVLADATAINDQGQIAGDGLFNGRARAFLLQAPESNPLIFIPGIAGSSLDIKGGVNLWLGGTFTDRSMLTLDPQKPQQDIVAPDVIRQASIAGQEMTVYEPLLHMLTTQGEYREYQVNNDPARRTTAGCDLSQKDNNPNLFVFAYDWRKSNAENAALLKDYVGCVQKFYPNTKVNVLTHSMGGLLARRYILDHPGEHNVNKMVAIAAPWLGAPKAIYVLETGKFLDIGDPIKDAVLDKILAPTLKSLVEFFPSVHQLLPSQIYYALGDPFGEMAGRSYWDVNGNGIVDESYTSGQVADLLDNKQFVRSKPAQAGSAFHDISGQDNWDNDQTGVEYYHLYGIQSRPLTIGKVLAVRRRGFDKQGEVIDLDEYETQNVLGDGTVPLLSAQSIGYAPKLTRHSFASASVAEDMLYDHTEMVQNPQIWNAILAALKPSQQSASASGLQSTALAHGRSLSLLKGGHPKSLGKEGAIIQDQSNQTEVGENYDLKITGIDQVLVTDAFGKDTSQIEGTPFRRNLPGVNIYETSESSVQILLPVEMPPDQFYTVAFRGTGQPILIELEKNKGSSETATQIIRYLDLNLPAGARLSLKITPLGVEDLRYDKDGDGVFETIIAPTASAIGAAAHDTHAPVISFSEKWQGAKRLVSIIAADQESGVKVVRYSLDGKKYQPYTTPLLIDPALTPALCVIADDNIANRSDTIVYKPLRPAITLSRDSITREIIVTATLHNESTGAVTANFVLNSAKLNKKATTTALPLTIGTLLSGETATRSVRFAANAAASGARATLSGSGSENGGAFSGSINVTVP